ncbi:MAG: ABC transporter ATP-binding protein [Candidatus Methanomethylicota archaeon]|uniref:ABC transporter ATP-binding protein n=1 Tax=Thermoproteota archaeon TaxID=2056631 RepID=A0A497F159_9CREN|nr:MAG: ABC transporter ATP-binding protein [Candidatus Verstraetearchaeota archaeon]RLE52658.1 MAG: ABC transporter ATP-binding protein [Candidatus Verstraetearchaeota archaeon]
MTFLKIEKLNAGYGRLHVLYDVDLEVSSREIVAIVGPNGSGKSTLLKSIFGLATVYSGSIRFNGVELSKLKPHEIAKLGIAYLPQVENVFANLTVAENLKLACYTMSKSEAENKVEEALSLFPVLKEYMNRKAYTLSGGERQMLAMAMALARKPKMMMFDEPTANMAPKLASVMLNKIIELRDTYDITILLVEQNAKKALEVSDSSCLLVAGKVVFRGGSKELLSRPDLSSMYLGVTMAA